MTQATPIDYKKIKSKLYFAPIETIKQTFKYTTQNQVFPPSSFLQKHYKSPHLFMNIRRRNEHNSTNMIYANIPAHGNWVK